MGVFNLKCALCNNNLVICSNRTYSPIGETNVYSEQKHVCINPECEAYSGKDLSNPKVVSKVSTNKISEV